MGLRTQNEIELRNRLFLQIAGEFFRLTTEKQKAVKAELPASLSVLVEQLENNGKLEDQPDTLDWSDLYVLESKVLDAQDLPYLKRKVWELRSRLAKLAGPEMYQLYFASLPSSEESSGQQTQKDEILADLSLLLSVFHRIYSMTLAKERLRKGVSQRLNQIAAIAAIVGLSIVGYFWWQHASANNHPWLELTLLLVIIFGIAGSYVSAQQRLQMPNEGDPFISALGLWGFQEASQLAMITGAIFAVLLWLMMTGNFVSGDVFPTLSNGMPSDGKGWAKLLVWSFVAGFAERLVPSALERLTSAVPDKLIVPPPTVEGVSAKNRIAKDQKQEVKDEQKESHTHRSEIYTKDEVEAMVKEFGPPAGPRQREDDEHRGKFGSEPANELFKTVVNHEVVADYSIIKLTVVQTSDVDGSDAEFFLSPRFTNKTSVKVPFKEGSASLTFPSLYPFVVGIIVSPTCDKLEIDLETAWK